MKKKTTYIIFIAGLLVGAIAFFSFMRRNAAPIAEREEAQAKAKQIYAELKAKDTDFSKGPCISEDLMPGWVADVAHNPRQAVDNEPANQCQSFRQGKAHHFVELDQDGNVIRAM